MKKIILLLSTFIILSLCLVGCSDSKNTNIEPEIKEEENIVETTQDDATVKELETLKEKENEIINKQQDRRNEFTIYIYEDKSFKEYPLPIPLSQQYKIVAESITSYLNTDIFPASIIQMEANKIYIDLNKANVEKLQADTNLEIRFLESFAKTFSENFGCLIYFTVDKNDYVSENFYFNKEEHYPLTIEE